MKPVILHQPGFAGDILFVQKIAAHYAGLGHPVIFPLAEQFAWMREALILPPGVSMPLLTEPFEHKDEAWQFAEAAVYGPIETRNLIFLPLLNCWKFDPPRTMDLKYEVAGLPMADWADHVQIRRDHGREDRLFYEVLKLSDGQEFTLVNEDHSKGSIPLVAPAPSIKMRRVDGFSLFDWSKVVERASRIVTVDTSLVLLVEVLRAQAKLHMVSRYDPPDFRPVQNMLRLRWQLALTPVDLDFSDTTPEPSASAA